MKIQTNAGLVTKACDKKPLPPEHWVEVDLSIQYLWAWEGTKLVNQTYVSTGRPGFDTPTGTFYINSKYRYDDMEGVINGEYYNASSIGFYLKPKMYLLNGRMTGLEFGSHYPDAPRNISKVTRTR